VAPLSLLERRRQRILDVLFKTLERHGFKAKTGERGEAHLEIEHERVEFALKEKFRQVRRPLTADEKRWASNPARPWRQEIQATGTLIFRIGTHLDRALKHEWTDSPETPIEKQLPEIVATLLLAEPIPKDRRRRHEEAERKRWDEERRRYEDEQRVKQDRNRWRHFVECAHRWREAEIARQFMAALEARLDVSDVPIGDRSAKQWIDWARVRLAEHDPLMGDAEPVLQDVAAVTSWTYRE